MLIRIAGILVIVGAIASPVVIYMESHVHSELPEILCMPVDLLFTISSLDNLEAPVERHCLRESACPSSAKGTEKSYLVIISFNFDIPHMFQGLSELFC
jgi:hypothetical protein